MAPKERPTPPHSRYLRGGRWSEQFGCYFITKCLLERKPILRRTEFAELILGSFQHLREQNQIRLMAFCIMPEHYHAVLFVIGERELSDLIRSVSSYTARRINARLQRSGPLWQEGFFDHRCRDEDDIEERIIYTEHNPVRAELVDAPEKWACSSAHPDRKAMVDWDWYAEIR